MTIKELTDEIQRLYDEIDAFEVEKYVAKQNHDVDGILAYRELIDYNRKEIRRLAAGLAEVAS